MRTTPVAPFPHHGPPPLADAAGEVRRGPGSRARPGWLCAAVAGTARATWALATVPARRSALTASPWPTVAAGSATALARGLRLFRLHACPLRRFGRREEFTLARGEFGEDRGIGRGAGERRPDLRLPQQTADVAALLGQFQGDDGAGSAGTSGPPGAVQVRLVLTRRVGVHHEADVVDVDPAGRDVGCDEGARSEEHTSELQSRFDLVCRLLLEK